MKEVAEEKEFRESCFKSCLEDLKHELNNYEKYYEMLKICFKIKEESLIKLNSIEERIRKDEHFTCLKEYLEKIEKEKEDVNVDR